MAVYGATLKQECLKYYYLYKSIGYMGDVMIYCHKSFTLYARVIL